MKKIIIGIIVIVIAITAWVTLRQKTYVNVGASMEPTLTDGERVKLSKDDNYSRGDLVIFEAPNNNAVYIKRIVGLPRETIELKDGKVYVNSVVLNENYTNGSTEARSISKYDLKDGEYFVLGDNRSDSSDSRDYGPVTSVRIIGKAISE